MCKRKIFVDKNLYRKKHRPGTTRCPNSHPLSNDYYTTTRTTYVHGSGGHRFVVRQPDDFILL